MPPSSEKRAALEWEMGGQFKRQDSWNDHERSRDAPKDYPKLFTLKFRHIAIFTLRYVITIQIANTNLTTSPFQHSVLCLLFLHHLQLPFPP